LEDSIFLACGISLLLDGFYFKIKFTTFSKTDPGIDFGIFKYFFPYSEFINKLKAIIFNCAQQKYKTNPDSKVMKTGKDTIGIK
jgi:hypothetical protein